MNRIKIVIVEDEALIADHIANILEAANYDVIAVFDEAEPFLDFLKGNKTDVVLLDINLNDDLDGVDIAHEINSKYKIPVVFLTSNTDKKTLERAKRTMPLSFIAKPYTARGLLSNLEIALHNYFDKNNTQEISIASNAIFVKDKNELVKVQYSFISHVQAMDNYAIIFTKDKKYIVPHTLKKLEEDLVPHGFIRTHRSYLVNKEKITSILPKVLKLNDIEIPLSDSYRQEVIGKLNML